MPAMESCSHPAGNVTWLMSPAEGDFTWPPGATQASGAGPWQGELWLLNEQFSVLLLQTTEVSLLSFHLQFLLSCHSTPNFTLF